MCESERYLRSPAQSQPIVYVAQVRLLAPTHARTLLPVNEWFELARGLSRASIERFIENSRTGWQLGPNRDCPREYRIVLTSGGIGEGR